MNWEQIEDHLNQFKGKIREEWSRFSENVSKSKEKNNSYWIGKVECRRAKKINPHSRHLRLVQT